MNDNVYDNFAGAFDKPGDSGQTAQRISNASFATLSLIYSLTEVFDLANSLSTLAGLTARVADLQEVHSFLQQTDKWDPSAVIATYSSLHSTCLLYKCLQNDATAAAAVILAGL